MKWIELIYRKGGESNETEKPAEKPSPKFPSDEYIKESEIYTPGKNQINSSEEDDKK